MLRILIVYVLPLLLPTVLYFLWLGAVGRRRQAAGGDPAAAVEVPWLWLFGAGLALALLVAGGTALMDGGKGAYTPAYVDESGRVVPGRIE